MRFVSLEHLLMSSMMWLHKCIIPQIFGIKMETVSGIRTLFGRCVWKSDGLCGVFRGAQSGDVAFATVLCYGM